jgi:Mor family transcriptional regulator
MDKESKIIKSALDSIPLDSKIYIEKMSDMVDRIHAIMQSKGIQTDEAKKILSEHWDCSIYNFTLRQIAKLEAMLGEDIIQIVK